MKRKEDRLTKVFRQTYEKQPESLYMQNKGEEEIPDLFDTPYIMDVTREYTATSDVEVELYDDVESADSSTCPSSTTKTGASCIGARATDGKPPSGTWHET
jgi:hypothetical protein